MDDMILQDLARQAGIALAQEELLLATAESCTGGWLGQVITSIAGSSAWYERGFITYADSSKHEMLGVSDATLKQYGAVSEQAASEMAAGLRGATLKSRCPLPALPAPRAAHRKNR